MPEPFAVTSHIDTHNHAINSLYTNVCVTQSTSSEILFLKQKLTVEILGQFARSNKKSDMLEQQAAILQKSL